MESTPQREDSDTPDEATSMHVRRALAGDRESLDWVMARLSPLLLAQAPRDGA